MRQFFSKGIVILSLVAALGLPGGAQGANFAYSSFRGEWGLRLGYGGNIHKASVRLYSLLPRWGIFLVRPGHQLGRLSLSFVVEGIFSIADAEDTGFELGITPMLKVSYVLFPWLIAYVEGGAGLITESINSPALAHSFNFTPQVGGGVDVALLPRLGLSLAYRFRHSSNAGLYKENPAFDCNFVHAGLTYYY
jgi:opacity protein-like surface antigen